MSSPAFTLARRLRAGETVYSAWCGLPEPLICEAIAREGFSAVTLDMQHGMWDTASALAAIASVHLAGAAPVVRVPLWENRNRQPHARFRRRRDHRADDQRHRRG